MAKRAEAAKRRGAVGSFSGLSKGSEVSAESAKSLITDYDYQKLIEQNPLSIIKLHELAPCLQVKLLSEPNRRIRNAESRERYARRINDTIKTLVAEKEANERKD